MHKTLKKVLTASAALLMLAGVGASTSNVSVSAHHRRTHRVYRHHHSAWSRRAPRAIRGYWARKHHHQVWGLAFRSTGVAFTPAGAPIDNWSKPLYKHDGYHAYSIKPSRHSHNNAGRVSGESYYVKVSGHHAKVWANGHYIGRYHKSSRAHLFG